MTKQFAKLERNLTSERNNFLVLCAHYARTRDVVLAPDCCDLVEFTHIEDHEVEQTDPHVEGIRRYFIEAEELLVTPCWAYEFLSYMHRVVINNLTAYGGDGGRERFLAHHKDALKFLELWRTRSFDRAERSFDHKTQWAQIVNLACDENVEHMLGNPIRRFNALARSKLVPVSKFVDGRELGKREDLLKGVQRHLQQLRPRREDCLKNRVDVESFALLAWLNETVPTHDFAAVTASRDPRNAYYAWIAEQTGHPASLVRSPIAVWICDRVTRAAGPGGPAYVGRAIELIDEILQQLASITGPALPREISPAEAVSPILIGRFRERSKLRSLLDEYDQFFRDPIITPIVTRPRNPTRTREFKLLGASEIAEALKPGEFEARMRRAAISLRAETSEMAGVARRFTAPAANVRLLDNTLDELVTRMERDFESNVF